MLLYLQTFLQDRHGIHTTREGLLKRGDIKAKGPQKNNTKCVINVDAHASHCRNIPTVKQIGRTRSGGNKQYLVAARKKHP